MDSGIHRRWRIHVSNTFVIYLGSFCIDDTNDEFHIGIEVTSKSKWKMGMIRKAINISLGGISINVLRFLNIYGIFNKVIEIQICN